MFFGGIFCGFLSDKFGRRPCLLYSLALNTLAGIVSSFVPNVKWLICCRVIGGIGIGGSVPAVFSLGAEIFASSVRGQLLSVIASFWMMGAIFVGTAAWIMLGNDLQGNRITPYTNWRYFAVVCSLPALAAFFLTYFLVPESPRFLVGKLKFEQAALVLNRISEIEVSEEALKDEFYKNNAHLLSDEVTQKKKEIKMFNVPVMFIHQKLRKTTLTLMIIWFTLSFGSYGITTWISTLFVDIGETNPYEDSFIFALANLPGNLISILLVDKYGRKNLLFFGMFFSSLCSIGFVLGVKNKDLVVFCAALFNAFSVIGWNSLDCLSVEMFPTSARTSAMGFLAGSG
jgi:MFS family permease